MTALAIPTPEFPKQQILLEAEKLSQRVSGKIPKARLESHIPYILEINRLKREKNAVILAHNYQTPEIYYGVADITGDSLQLAVAASKTKADLIIQCGVHFMAETSKILNPEKTVLIPDLRAGCSLAESITGDDVRLLRQKYPGTPIVTYVNTSAEVKAESDVCCTSSNAVKIVEAVAKESGSPQVLVIPDEYLAKYVATQTKVKILSWHGHCEVHERFTALEIKQYKKSNPGVVILAHPECPPDVIAEADFTGSTSAMAKYVDDRKPSKVIMITECSMSDNIAIENPTTEFVRPCNLCPHMKRIDLQNILLSLQTGQHEIMVDPKISAKARIAVEKMIAMSQAPG